METDLYNTTDLKSRGWTDSLIRKFLELHDETQPNPKYPNAGSPMKLYRRERIRKAEASEEFQQAKRKADARKTAAKKGVETKLAKMNEYIFNLEIEVPVMERNALIKVARENFIALGLPHYVEVSDEQNCVNYLRHCGTKYERELDAIGGKVGAVDAYYEIKEMVLREIAFAYDWLAEECERQRDKMNKKRLEVF